MIVILNQGAGTAVTSHDVQSTVSDLFAAAGVRPRIVVATAEEISTIVKNAIDQGEDTIVVGGGDGTISAVAAHLAGTGRTLGVLPLGTLNHFARDLGIVDLAGAVQTIAEGHIADIDVAEVNGCVFVNNSSLGIYPQIVRRREVQQTRLGLGKWPAFISAAVVSFRRFPFVHVRIALEGQALDRKSAFVFIGNNEYHMAGFRIGARTRLDCGKLGLYLAHRVGRWGMIRLAVRALAGNLDQEKDFEAYRVEEAFIETRASSLLVATDGEVNRLQSPLRYRSRPGALRVFVPRTRVA